MAQLTLKAISKRFGVTNALESVNFSVRGGEIHSLIGENGAGKSTLMKILAGHLAADEGSISIDGRVSMIHQELSLAPHLSVEDCFALGHEPTFFGFLRRRKMREQARHALNDYPEIRPETKVSTLSVSAQQQVEIARAIARGGNILVLDEPTSSLSKKDVAVLFRKLRALKERGYAIVYISHFLEEVREISDRITVLRDGRVAGTFEASAISQERMIELMVGRKIEDLYPKSKHPTGSTLLEVETDQGSLNLRRGEVVGIAGLVGSGRSRFLRKVFGEPSRAFKHGVGLVSEDRKEEGLALSLSIAQNLVLSRPVSGACAAAEPWIRKLAIRCESADQPVEALSGGNQQKVAIARLLHHGVEVFLLDEPTRGIDIGSKAEIYRLIDELALAGKAILIVSSYMSELLGVCDRIAVMQRGKLAPSRPATEWHEHTLIAEASR